jgi:hypothetical protein
MDNLGPAELVVVLVEQAGGEEKILQEKIAQTPIAGADGGGAVK